MLTDKTIEKLRILTESAKYDVSCSSSGTVRKGKQGMVGNTVVRENRLYQADWLMRFYHFNVDEIVDDQHAHLDLDVDPKLGWALRHPEFFPIDINSASYEEILRVPGIGVKSAVLIVNSRRFNRITSYHLKKMGVVMKKAKYFITCGELTSSFSQPIIGINELRPERLRPLLLSKAQQKRAAQEQQLSLDFQDDNP